MGMCPKCKSEYREGFTTCKDCNIDLVDDINIEDNESEKEYGYDNWVFLKNVSDGYEVTTIESLFEDNNIPLLKKQKEMGSYMKITMGVSYYGVDLYVPNKYFEEANNFISYLDSPSDNIDSIDKINDSENIRDSEEFFNNKFFPSKKRFSAWVRIYLLTLAITLLIFIINSIIKLMTK